VTAQSTAGGDLHAPSTRLYSPAHPIRGAARAVALRPARPHQPASPVPDASQAVLPAQLASRIVTEYTQPGALLVGPACPTLLHQAARLGRRAVALTTDPARARQTSTTLDLTLPTQRRALVRVRRGALTDPRPSPS
jgi:hypothetical protein